jgi:hypothetical protein
VRRLDKLVIAPDRQALGIRQRLLKLACHFVHSHQNLAPRIQGYTCNDGGNSGGFKAAACNQAAAHSAAGTVIRHTTRIWGTRHRKAHCVPALPGHCCSGQPACPVPDSAETKNK